VPTHKNISKIYTSSGVNLDNSEKVKDQIKSIAQNTYDSNVIGGVGGFGALYKISGYDQPILVSSTDPVGTKLSVAGMFNDYSNIGIDLVNACINDLIVVGADPLFFLDYIATSVMDPEIVVTIVKGISQMCEDSNCALIGGETSEMPGVFQAGKFDISGFVVGAVEASKMLNPHQNIQVNDDLIGIPSNGLHTNGYSLVRHIFKLEEDTSPLFQQFDGIENSLGKELLKPHISYYKTLRPVYELVNGIAHITGGGLFENVPRILPENMMAIFDSKSWNVQQIFNLIQNQGQVESIEMYHVFNMGLGMVLSVNPENTDLVLKYIPSSMVVGKVAEKTSVDQVVIENL
tara:strand:+ start:554 stop:1594 length:1041 start_codon:yes stop_codon:yes gene_type:complete